MPVLHFGIGIIAERGGTVIKDLRWSLTVAVTLIVGSVAIYMAQILIFNDIKNTMFYFFQDMAFVPLQVFLVTLVLNQFLSRREKQQKLRKMNIVISAFFNEIGISCIEILSNYTTNFHQLKNELKQDADWSNSLDQMLKRVGKFEYVIDSSKGNLATLKDYLMDRKDYILGMFENPNLLEHDAFTDMLWAVYHLADELENREDLEGLPQNDLKHLSVDMERAFKLLIIEWAYYMNHLKKEYPYLFSLAVRKNPFAENKVIFH